MEQICRMESSLLVHDEQGVKTSKGGVNSSSGVCLPAVGRYLGKWASPPCHRQVTFSLCVSLAC